MRQEKQLLLDEIKGQLEQKPTFVLLSYSSMASNVANAFRSEIAKSGGSVEIVRKRVLIKAAEATGITIEKEMLEGHIGVVFVGNDAIETTKSVFTFSKDNGDVLKVVGGRYDGKLCSAAQVEILSKLPSKDVMRAQFLGLLEAPMAQTLAVIEALLTSVPYCLENKAGQQEGDKP